MTRTVLVRHPAAIRHVPKGGRHERVSQARIETPAFLRTADPDGFRELAPPFGRETGIRTREGRLWAPLRFGPAAARRSIAPADFALFMEGGLDAVRPDLANLLRAKFARTPLVAMAMAEIRPGEFAMHADAGKAMRVESSRSISRDHRAECGLALATFVETELAVVGDEVWRRIRPLALYERQSSDRPVSLATLPHANGRGPFHLALDRVGEHLGNLASGREAVPAVGDGLARLIGALPDGYSPDDDVAYLANELPGLVMRIRPGRFERDGVAERLADLQSRLADHDMAAATGRIGLADAPAVLGLVHEAAAWWSVEHPHANPLNELVRAVRDHLAANVLPRLDAAPDAEDLAALSM